MSSYPLKTPLYDWHVAHAGRMVPFAGYTMPVQYAAGVMTEHNHTRSAAGLFDVSHMGQARLIAADGSYETVASALEWLVPADALNLKPGHQRYSQLLNEAGGILDDLMFFRPSAARQVGTINLIVNAACKAADYTWIAKHLPGGIALQPREELALIALQGPKAESVLAELFPVVAHLKFMQVAEVSYRGNAIDVGRAGYTGEDGFEISLPSSVSEELWTALAARADVLPVGLGARDSLRLEGGLCLYGNDIDTNTSPIEANLGWSIQKRRRTEGGFIGAGRILLELKDGPAQLRIGLKPEGRAPLRAGVALFADQTSSEVIGRVTSGGFGPTMNAPVAMGYATRANATTGNRLSGELRGQRVPITVVDLPFVPNRFKR